MRLLQVHTYNQRHRSQATVELALCMTILMVVVLGSIDLCMLYNKYIRIANAAREGARGGAVGQSSTLTVQRATNAIIGLTSGVTLERSTDNGATWSAWPTDVGTNNNIPVGNLIRVSVTTTNKSVASGLIPWLQNLSIQQKTVLRRE